MSEISSAFFVVLLSCSDLLLRMAAALKDLLEKAKAAGTFDASQPETISTLDAVVRERTLAS